MKRKRPQDLPPLEPDDPRHGTINGYCNRGCRCQRCRDAWADWNVERRRARHTILDPEDERHGLVNTYLNHHCRCDRCKAAASRARAAAKVGSSRRIIIGSARANGR